MKKAVEKVNKHNFNGRPLKVKEVGHWEKKKREAKRQKCQLWIFLSHIFMFYQDPDGVIAQREINKSQGGGPQGGHGGMGGMDRMGPGPNGPMVNIPPSLMNNPNIPNEIIHGLQAGRIGNTVFVANVRLPDFSHCLYFIKAQMYGIQ